MILFRTNGSEVFSNGATVQFIKNAFPCLNSVIFFSSEVYKAFFEWLALKNSVNLMFVLCRSLIKGAYFVS